MDIFGGISWLFGVVINRPLGYILGLCYHLTPNYAVALLLFTLITRVILFPLSIKQQHSSSEMVRLRPKIEQLNKKHAKDKTKLSEATMKLYQEEGYNPMGGCLPLLIQMPILFGLFNVIYKPLSFIVGLTSDQITTIVTKLWEPIKALAGAQVGTDAAKAISGGRVELFAAVAMKNPVNFSQVSDILPKNVLRLNFDFFGMDLSQQPALNKVSALLIIPILCYVTSLLSSWITMNFAKVSQPAAVAGAPNPAGMNKSMLLIMPFVSAFFATTVPAGIGIYWIYTNLFMILQAYLLNIFFNPIKLAEKGEIASQKRKSKLKLNAKPITITEQTATQEDESQFTDQAQIKSPEVYHDISSDTDVKKTKKQLMDENRRRLSASRLSDSKKRDN
jgi:YidC/Oxa1 family membrane protein insertase